MGQILYRSLDPSKKRRQSAIVATQIDQILGLSEMAQLMGEPCDFQTELELVVTMFSKEYKNDIVQFIKGIDFRRGCLHHFYITFILHQNFCIYSKIFTFFTPKILIFYPKIFAFLP